MNTQDKWFLAIGGVGVVAGIYFLSRSAKAKPIVTAQVPPYIDQKYPGGPTQPSIEATAGNCRYVVKTVYKDGAFGPEIQPPFPPPGSDPKSHALNWFKAVSDGYFLSSAGVGPHLDSVQLRQECDGNKITILYFRKIA